MPQNLPASFCSFTGSYVVLIRISAKLDVDLCVTFLNFQMDSIWKDLVNTITLHNLLVSSCSLTVVFSTSKSWTSSVFIFVWHFELSKLAHGHTTPVGCEKNLSTVFPACRKRRLIGNCIWSCPRGETSSSFCDDVSPYANGLPALDIVLIWFQFWVSLLFCHHMTIAVECDVNPYSTKQAQGQTALWTSQVLLIWCCCNFIGEFFTSTYQRNSMMTFVCPFWTFKLAQGQVALWTQ